MTYDNFEFVNGKALNLTPVETIELNKRIRNLGQTDVPLTSRWACHAFDLSAELGFTGNRNSKDTFNSICVDALKAIAGGYWVSYSRNNDKYFALRCGSIGYSILMKSIQFLLERNFIRTVIPHANPHIDFQSVFQGTDLFYAAYGYLLAQDKAITFEETRQSVRYKKRNTRIFSRLPDTPFFHNALREADRQNAFLNEFEIGFEPKLGESIGSLRKFTLSVRTADGQSNEKHYCADLQKTPYHRTFIGEFSGDPLLGGRYYGPYWQGLSESMRRQITIDGEEVDREIDFNCMHPRMAYAQAGIIKPYNYDAYDFDCNLKIPINSIDWRKFIKTVVNALICSSNEHQGFGVIQKELLGRFPHIYECRAATEFDARRVHAAILKEHVAISHFFSSDAGVRLQFLDSQVMTSIHAKARALGIPVLSIHDSILYPPSHRNVTQTIFHDTFELFLRNLQTGQWEMVA